MLKFRIFISILSFCSVAGLLVKCAAKKHASGSAGVAVLLPTSLQNSKFEFSSMAWLNNELVLVPQYPDRFDNELYSVQQIDIDNAIKGGHQIPSARVLKLRNIQLVIDRIGGTYEGFEATAIIDGKIFFAIETSAKNADCYIASGKILGDNILLDADKLISLPKLKRLNNAGYESMAWLAGPKKLIAFFEYNKADAGAKAWLIDTSMISPPQQISFNPLMYRLTDVAAVGSHSLIGINFHYNASRKEFDEYIGADSMKTAPEFKGKTYRQTSYSRIIELKLQGSAVRWSPKHEISFISDNWEAIAPYKNGALILSDEYPGSVMKWIKF